MKTYVSPEIKIESFQTSDVLTVSLILRINYPTQTPGEMDADYETTFWS